VLGVAVTSVPNFENLSFCQEGIRANREPRVAIFKNVDMVQGTRKISYLSDHSFLYYENLTFLRLFPKEHFSQFPLCWVS
jgi:hypothetical protein